MELAHNRVGEMVIFQRDMAAELFFSSVFLMCWAPQGKHHRVPLYSREGRHLYSPVCPKLDKSPLNIDGFWMDQLYCSPPLPKECVSLYVSVFQTNPTVVPKLLFAQHLMQRSALGDFALTLTQMDKLDFVLWAAPWKRAVGNALPTLECSNT